MTAERQNEIAELETALEDFRRQAQDDPDTNLPQVAAVANNLGAIMTEEGRFGDSGGYLAEALILHMVLWLREPQEFAPRLGTTLGNIKELAERMEAGESRMWLGQLWQIVVYNLKRNCLPFARELGGLFEELGHPDLALEPYMLGVIMLEEAGSEDLPKAQYDVDRVSEILGPEAPALKIRARQQLAEMLARQPG